jgi:polyisoprenoid-binding protein YceI
MFGAMRFLTFLFWLLALPAFADPVAYTLQADQSRVAFTWAFGQTPVTGRMPVSRADLALDFDRPENSRVAVTLNAASANPGNPLADGAMKGNSVLWTDKYPEISFVSKRVRRDGQGGAIIDGDLTMRGVTRPQTLRARLYRPGNTNPGDRRRLTIRLDGSLSRAAFGADGYKSMVGDRIVLDISALIVQSR